MSQNDLPFLTIAELAPKIRSREISPVEVTKAILDRIEAYNPRLHAYITPLPERALGVAQAVEKAIASGVYLGPLHGIPIGLKDLFEIEGIRTTAGSQSRKDFVPDATATVATRLEEAGTILLGKLNMVEFAFGASGANPYFDTARTPWEPSRVAGGSSSGSGAAVAAGLAIAALGTDTGGSVRIPAALCGIVGLKPTYGRVSTFGVVPLSWTLDSVGPMTKSVEDAALMLAAMIGPDPRDPTTLDGPPFEIPQFSEDIKGMRLGIPRAWFYDDIDGEVAEAVSQAADLLLGMGASIVDFDMPGLDEESLRRRFTVVPAEAYTYHEPALRERPQEFGPFIRDRIGGGREILATDYIRALQDHRRIKGEMKSKMAQVDALITPTTPVPALPLEDDEEKRQRILLRNTWMANWMGLCAITVPCGFTSAGLPVGLQIMGKPYDEATVLKLAYAYEQGSEWHLRRPSL